MEIRHGDTLVIIDAGSGIRQLGQTLAEISPQCIHLLMTHTHWDHIQGLPFFAPAYNNANQVNVYSGIRADGLMETMRGQMRTPYFPVSFDAVANNFSFRPVTSQLEIGSIQIRSQSLPHPGRSLGYRLEADGQTIVVATDCELDNPSLGKDAPNTPWYQDFAMLDFFADADIIVIDCQYTDEEYRDKVGRGHNSISTVVELARRACPQELVLFHHDPESGDDKIDAMVRQANRQLADSGHYSTKITAAEELSSRSVCREFDAMMA